MVARPLSDNARHGIAVLAAVGLALLMAAPVLPDPTTRALGHAGNDVWNHVWGFWFVFESLAAGELPVRSELLAWPHGGSLWFIDAFNAVLTAPIQAIAGPVAAYNASVVGNL
ncbi:MAG: hypothetical protein VX000_05605, partial [Myxococcota bacterium]|nr:hypothetical protein [Myxococcota bacterium]